MTTNYLLCPLCKCPLSPPSHQATGMYCPRCNTYVAIDPDCPGSCLSCHKATEAEPDICVEAEGVVSGPHVVQKKEG